MPKRRKPGRSRNPRPAPRPLAPFLPAPTPFASAPPTPAPSPAPPAPLTPAPLPAPSAPPTLAPSPAPPAPPAPAPLPASPVPVAQPHGGAAPPPTAAELQRLIDDACRFIRRRKAEHAAGIAWEVGEFLFERVYRGDLRAVESRYRRKPDALARIAARSGIGRLRLSAWIRAYIARKYLGAAGLDVDLPMSDFEALRPLALHPDAAREVLALRARHHLSTKRLDALAVEWRRRLDEGGRLEDLVAAVRPVAASPRPGKPRPHHPLAGADLVPLRLALVVSRWLHAATLAPRLRAGLSEEIRRLRTAVASGIAPPPSLLAAPESPASDLAAPGASGPEPTEEPGASDEVVDAAVRFIAQCVRRHGLRFALEVGEYLFREVYRGNRASFRNGGLQWQRDTIQTIARDPRVGLESSFLYKSIHAYLLVGLAAQNVPADALPELSLNKWEALWPLEENPAALAQVGTWAAAERVPAATVAEIAALVAPYVARGGSLDDLLAGSARRPPDTPYRRIRRLLGVIRSLLAERPVSPAARPRLLSALDACRTGPERPPADRGGESGKSGKRTGPA